jgi:hypothetical protein
MKSLKFFRHVVLVASATVVVTAAGCNNPPPPAARVYMNSQLGPGANPSSVCRFPTADWIVIGSSSINFDAGHQRSITPVQDGDTYNGAAVSVTCTVQQSGSGFNLNLTTTLAGIQGGSVTITGYVSGDTSQPATGLRATFTRGDTGTFIEQASGDDPGCTIRYVNTQDPSSTDPFGVAAGRVWGFLSCPTAKKSGESSPNPDGGAPIPRTCDGEAEFRFEECGQ